MIPKVIHQIWEGKNGQLPPGAFIELSETWKINHPEWEYEFWDGDRIKQFIQDYYPKYYETYLSFPYDAQRWDFVRYLILYKMGGMYVDIDYECISNVEKLLKTDCCFAMEPEQHVPEKYKGVCFNNALMAIAPSHDFIRFVINYIANLEITKDHRIKKEIVLNTTGPLMLTKLYLKYPLKDDICLIPAKYVSPFNKQQSWNVLNGLESGVDDLLQEAYAVHYFMGSWMR